MREYGGYIEFEYFSGREYHDGAIALNSGRHCVEYLIKARNIRKLYMPYFLCDSVFLICKRLGVEVEYYRIDINFEPVFEKMPENGEWLYIVNFYGQLSRARIEKIKEKYKNIIVDNVQAFFEKPLTSVDTCYTCRKFFGVADGGYLYTDAVLDGDLPQDMSYDRMEFLFGRAERTASEFYSQYVKNNDLFESEPLKRMSKTTQNLMRGVDYERIRQIRTQNFALMHERLGTINKLKLTVPDGAFMYPLYVENGAEIRKKLQGKKIYIPTLWPNVLELCREGELEHDMAKNILPLPIDQRYGKEDINEIINAVLCIIKK